MRAFSLRKFPVLTILTAVFCASAAPGRLLADDEKDKNPAAAKTAPAKANAADAGLTERERMLLDRVEQLEKRVAELEAKEPGGAAAAPAGAVSASGTTAGPTTGAIGTNTAGASMASPAAATSPAMNASTLAPGAVAAVSPRQDQSAATGTAAVATAAKPGYVEPFSDADWTWLNGSPRTKEIYWDSKFFTPEIRFDTNYVADFNHPSDHTIGGSSELFRSYEVQLEQLGLGGDFHFDNVRGRFMTQYGMYSATTPRNDASPAHGQWDLDTAYRYLAEAYGGYHFNVLHGVNVDAGIFLSYIGLFSYYNFDNWAYQPSYVSSNTPWFFNGVRVQIFPTAHLKIEPWFINGWQSYASANHMPGVGGQIKWTPKPWINIISNNYGVGEDDLFIKGRSRIHTDDSVEVKYYDKPEKTLDKMAFSLTGDLGCEYGSGVSCYGDRKGGQQYVLGPK